VVALEIWRGLLGEMVALVVVVELTALLEALEQRGRAMLVAPEVRGQALMALVVVVALVA
jgi:hypothetical protein